MFLTKFYIKKMQFVLRIGKLYFMLYDILITASKELQLGRIMSVQNDLGKAAKLQQVCQFHLLSYYFSLPFTPIRVSSNFYSIQYLNLFRLIFILILYS